MGNTVLRGRLVYAIILAWVLAQGVCHASPTIETRGGMVWTFAGTVDYEVYFRKDYQNDSPVVLALHGCKINGKDFYELAQLEQLVEDYNAIVITPNQYTYRNLDRCWNWFLPHNQNRVTGDPWRLLSLVDNIAGDFNLSNSKLFGIGFSSGAALLSSLAATYRDRFHGVLVHAGVSYLGASDPVSAMQVLNQGTGFSQETGGRFALLAGVGKTMPKVLVVHGAEDVRLDPVNGDQTARQFAALADLLDDSLYNGSSPLHPTEEQHRVPHGHSWRIGYFGEKNEAQVWQVTVDGLAHKWSGGKPHHRYADDKGPDVLRHAMDWWLQTP